MTRPHRSRRFLAPLLAALALAAAAPGAAAQSMEFLRGSPLNHFDKEDVRLMMDNVRRVLASESGAKSGWTNPKTGHSGEAETIGDFSADGMKCKRLRVSNSAKGLQAEMVYPLCDYPHKGWKVRPEK